MMYENKTKHKQFILDAGTQAGGHVMNNINLNKLGF